MARRRGPSQSRLTAVPRGGSLGSRSIGSGERPRWRGAAGIGGFGIRSAPRPVPPRVLILSWEYPPIVEGGLARHVRKLAEQLVAQGTEVHVLTRGGGHLAAEEVRHGVIVHRVREPDFPKDD